MCNLQGADVDDFNCDEKDAYITPCKVRKCRKGQGGNCHKDEVIAMYTGRLCHSSLICLGGKCFGSSGGEDTNMNYYSGRNNLRFRSTNEIR